MRAQERSAARAGWAAAAHPVVARVHGADDGVAAAGDVLLVVVVVVAVAGAVEAVAVADARAGQDVHALLRLHGVLVAVHHLPRPKPRVSNGCLKESHIVCCIPVKYDGLLAMSAP